jgi:hypothetical protein
MVIWPAPPGRRSTSALAAFHGGGVNQRVIRAGSIQQQGSLSRGPFAKSEKTSSSSAVAAAAVAIMDLAFGREEG